MSCEHKAGDVVARTDTFDLALDGVTLGTMTAEILFCGRCGSTFWMPAEGPQGAHPL